MVVTVLCVVATTALGGGAVRDTVGAVGGRVVGGTMASAGGGQSNRGHYNKEEKHAAHNHSAVETDTAFGIAPPPSFVL